MITNRAALSLCLIALPAACRTASEPATAASSPDAVEAATARAAVPEPRSPALPELARELLAMAAVDQEVRNEFVAFAREHPGKQPDRKLALQMLATDAENTERMQAIVAEHGWPTPELVGTDASHAAWLLVQHADAAPEFQAEMLELIEPLVEAGAIEKSDFALLTDRVLVARGEPQLYGTQYVLKSSALGTTFAPSTPIRDPERLEERRAAMDLGPHAAYVEKLRAVMGVPEEVSDAPR